MSVPVQYAIGGRSASEIARSVENALRGGHLAPGGPLPTVRALAARLGLSPATVAAAYRFLRARGLVTGQGRRGPGDRVAVEDPGDSGVLDLLGALGLVPEPMALDDEGVRPEALAAALAGGAQAVVLTPRAQNPTGAAFTPSRARRLRVLLDEHPGLLVVEDDHAGPVAGVPALTVCHRRRERWAVVRSVSKWLG